MQVVRILLCAAYAGLLLTDVKTPSHRSGSCSSLGQISSHCHVFRGGNFKIAMPLYVTDLLAVLAAFATSSPEMAVSSMAAASGEPGIGLGDALGSNVVNLGLILDIALFFGQLAASLHEFKRDFVLALVVPSLTLLLALDGELSRADGLLLLALCLLWMTLAVRQVVTQCRTTPVTADPPVAAARAGLLLLVMLAALIAAGRLFVTGASGLASAMGVHPYVIGATLVAIGTSLPELVTVLLSRLRSHDDVGLGTLLGSNLFNGLAIVGTATTIQPIRAPLGELAVAPTLHLSS